MGNAHSSKYHSLNGKPIVAPVVNIYSEGEEYVRFVGTIWTQILQPEYSFNSHHQHVFRKAKAIVVQGQLTGEIHYLSRDALLAAFDGDLHKVSHFVNKKKNYAVHVRWSLGYVTDPKTGKLKDSCYVHPTPDPSTGEIMRKIGDLSDYMPDLEHDEKDVDPFRAEDVRLDHKFGL